MNPVRTLQKSHTLVCYRLNRSTGIPEGEKMGKEKQKDAKEKEKSKEELKKLKLQRKLERERRKAQERAKMTMHRY
jgi:hypothetical protein